MTFSDSAVTDVVVDTSGETASFGAAAADELREQLMAAGSAEIDGVSGSTVTSDAVMKAAKSCYAQAKGEAVVVQRAAAHRRRERLAGHRARHRRGRHHRDHGTPTSSSWAQATAVCAQPPMLLQNGLDFRLIEQNATVMDTRHWYGAIDSSCSKENRRSLRLTAPSC